MIVFPENCEFPADALYLSPMKHIVFTLLLLVGSSISVHAQRNVKDSIIGTPWIAVHYGGNGTGGDLAQRYGFLNHVGVLAGYKTSHNWFYGVDGNFLFGNRIFLPDMFGHLRDSKGNITDQNGDIGTVVTFVRGFNANLAFGKVIPVFSPNKNSGIFVHAGLGYMAHKIRIETNDQVIPQLELDYRKGYDRLTVGLSLHQFVGYAFMSNRGLVNFYGGLYFNQGFTHNARDIFFDQPDVPVSKDLRQDLQYGFKLGWFIPIYKRLPKDFYTN